VPDDPRQLQRRLTAVAGRSRLDSPAERVATAAQTACLLELMAPKPGNVRHGADLPRLTSGALTLSALAIGPAFRRHASGGLGRLILEAVRATRRHVPTNTNLGIILLLAPLAKAARLAARGGPRSRGTAAERRTAGDPPPAGLRDALRRVLRGLDVRDARNAYRAIRLAQPGGLGRVREQDVASEPTVSLLWAMRLAAARDAVASEYATDFEATFATGLPTLLRLRLRRVSLAAAIAHTHLTLLAGRLDTLILRRHGVMAAREVSRAARRVLEAGGMLTPRGRRMAAALDRRLRRARPPLNPGATADLTVASLFVWLLHARPGRVLARAARGRVRKR
jgi:triphosphoribosyl-dephospho-CoA synthase